MYSPSVVSVLVLVSSIGVAIAATTSNSSTVKSPSSTSARPATSNSTRKVLTFRQRFGSVDEQCTCVVFHFCDNDKVINIPTADGRDRCIGDEVCCSGDTSPLPPQTDPTSPPSSLPSASDCDDGCNVIQNTTDLTTVPTPAPTPLVDVPSQPSVDVRLSMSTESSNTSLVSVVEQECGIKGKTYNEDIRNYESGTVFGEFPWIAALLKTNNNSSDGVIICEASIISPSIILTAAHCVNKIDNIHSLKVRVGEYSIGSDENETHPHQDRTVNAIHIHPSYNPKRLYNDLALLSVNEPFVYDSYVNGICVPLIGTPYAKKNSYDPKRCWAIGWRKGNFTDKTIQHKLRKVELPIVNANECQKKLRTTRLGAKFVLDSSFLCAGGQPGYDSCRPEGSGPLFCASRSNEHKLIQVGVVSWTVGCSSTIPAVYASLEANREWLTNKINTMSVSGTFP